MAQRHLPALLLVLAAAGCESKDEDSGTSGVGEAGGGVGGDGGTDGGDGTDGTDGGDGTDGTDGGEGAYPSCRAEEGDAFEVYEVGVSGDELRVTVAYSGGCADHLFTLCWPEPSFMESEPVQVQLELLHDGMGDGCEAYPSETRAFDLAPLAQAWRDSYGAESGTIVVHLHGHSVEYSF